jgi:hypothetical protein
VIPVKANQAKLLESLHQQFDQQVPQSVAVEVEQTRNRKTQRTVSGLEPDRSINPAWMGVQRMVRLERTGTRSGQPYAATMFYIRLLGVDAPEFAGRIR